MAFYGFLGFSLYLFIKRHPDQSHNLLKHANGIIKYMPIDRDATDMLTPIFSFTKDGFQNQGDNRGASRILTSGGASGASGGTTKRSVSETKEICGVSAKLALPRLLRAIDRMVGGSP